MEKAVIALRVSTTRQDEQNQLDACEKLCAARGWEVVEVIRWKSTGTKDSEEKLQAMGGVLEGKYKNIVVWALDRWSRQGIEHTLTDMSRLEAAGGRLVSVKESFTHDPLYGPLLAAILAWVAKFESDRRRDRTNEGIAESRRKLANGPYWREKDGQMRKVERIGRAPIGELDGQQLALCLEWRNEGVSWRHLPKKLKAAGVQFANGKDSEWASLRLRIVAAQKKAKTKGPVP